MDIVIKRTRIKENKSNEVTSDKIFKPRRIKDQYGNWRFHEEGIFSERIFGKFGKCRCGYLREEGKICPYCDCRVVNASRMPNFYIPFEGINIPYLDVDYTIFGKDADKVKSLMAYQSFLYDGEVVELDLEKLDLTQYPDESKMLFGKDAVLSLGLPEATEEWFDNQVTDKISIPHPSFRNIIATPNGKYVLGELNEVLIELLRKRREALTFKDKFMDGQLIGMNVVNKIIVEKVYEMYGKLFDQLVKNKSSIIKHEVRGQSLTGAVRAVLTNNFQLPEDVVVIGKEFIDTLYPWLAKKYTDENGEIDIWGLNNELAEENYLVLVNRPPTIGEKSIIAMKPIFSEDEDHRFVMGTNPIIYDGLAGDTDGDVLLIISLYSKEACKEAIKLLPSKNYIGGESGLVRNKIPEDFVYIMKNIYEKDPSVKAQIQSIIEKGEEEEASYGSQNI